MLIIIIIDDRSVSSLLLSIPLHLNPFLISLWTGKREKWRFCRHLPESTIANSLPSLFIMRRILLYRFDWHTKTCYEFVRNLFTLSRCKLFDGVVTQQQAPLQTNDERCSFDFFFLPHQPSSSTNVNDVFTYLRFVCLIILLFFQ